MVARDEQLVDVAAGPGGGGGGDGGGKVTDPVFASLVAEPALVLIEREDIRTLLDEQALNLSGLANPAEATRVGQPTGARISVTGSGGNAGRERISPTSARSSAAI